MKQQNHQWSLSFRYLVFGVVFILLAVGLWYTRSILEPLIIAAFIAYLIHPAVNFLTRRTRLSRPAAVNLVYFITLAVLIGTPSTLAPIFFDEFKQVIADVLNIFNQLIVWLVKPHVIPGIPIDFGQLANWLTQFRSTFLSSLPDQALQLLGKTSVGALWLLVILAAVYYFLAEWPHLRNGFIGSFPDAYHPELNELYQRVRSIWMNYLRGQLLLMAIVGVTFTIAWTVIGIPGALVLGVVAGFLTLIPDVGPFLAAVLAIGVALLEGSNWSWMPASSFIVALIALAIYLILITIKNFWLRPFIMGRSVHMHEALVLISIILATILWGLLGALLIVPVLASFVVIFDYLRRRIMGMPPFPPTEPFVLETPPVSGSEKVEALKSRISRKKKG
ncbi:MAG: AI-2E family transporter [Chloroflexi bacterium]|nr:AI-2E family transporter [Chloroflexota bacterium]MBE3117676.1 AI-2E family transporter [Candidatus Atribacteria bacterium]